MASRAPEHRVESRWWPPSPHREEIVRILKLGRAHIEAQGHARPPLLIYEDGGAMELPKVRYADGQFVAAGGSEPERQTTRFLDVCGTVDKLKELFEEPPTAATDEAIRKLLDDAQYMLARMHERLGAYAEFVARLEELCRRLQRP